MTFSISKKNVSTKTSRSSIFVKVFQSVHVKFLDALHYLQNHPSTVEDVKTTIPSASTGQDHSKRSILFRLGNAFLAILGGASLGHYDKTTISKIKKDLHKSKENQNLQSRQTQDEVALLYVARVEMDNQRKLLHILDLAPVRIQHTYTDKFIYVEKSGNMLLSLTNNNTMLCYVINENGVTHVLQFCFEQLAFLWRNFQAILS